MIPKRIIYCWFGGEKPKKVQECIEQWHKLMPNWEFLEINEDSFDINYNDYVKEAYKNKKYAYVSDIARLYGLYNYGGIYMDTDVWVYKSLDKFLIYDFFTGFEQPNYPITATMGAMKGNKLIKEMLEVYDNKEFKVHENWKDYETNTMILSNIISKYFNRYNMEYQEVDNMAIFPKEVLCNSEQITDEVYTRHLMFGSWI